MLQFLWECPSHHRCPRMAPAVPAASSASSPSVCRSASISLFCCHLLAVFSQRCPQPRWRAGPWLWQRSPSAAGPLRAGLQRLRAGPGCGGPRGSGTAVHRDGCAQTRLCSGTAVLMVSVCTGTAVLRDGCAHGLSVLRDSCAQGLSVLRVSVCSGSRCAALQGISTAGDGWTSRRGPSTHPTGQRGITPRESLVPGTSWLRRTR